MQLSLDTQTQLVGLLAGGSGGLASIQSIEVRSRRFNGAERSVENCFVLLLEVTNPYIYQTIHRSFIGKQYRVDVSADKDKEPQMAKVMDRQQLRAATCFNIRATSTTRCELMGAFSFDLTKHSRQRQSGFQRLCPSVNVNSSTEFAYFDSVNS